MGIDRSALRRDLLRTSWVLALMAVPLLFALAQPAYAARSWDGPRLRGVAIHTGTAAIRVQAGHAAWSAGYRAWRTTSLSGFRTFLSTWASTGERLYRYRRKPHPVRPPAEETTTPPPATDTSTTPSGDTTITPPSGDTTITPPSGETTPPTSGETTVVPPLPSGDPTPPPPPPTPPAKRWIGFYVPGAPASISPLTSLESQIGMQASVSNYFQAATQGFTLSQATNASNAGATPLITLEFWSPAAGVDQPSYRLANIANGSFDTYLRTYARSAKSFGKPVWLRPFHEMNGNWYPWAGSVNGNSTADFIAAWRHMRDIFNSEGATNVKFVWSPNVDSVPNTTANAIARYWPGDSYVDLIALDGYNFGTSSSSWRSFGSVFGSAYAAVTPLSNKPIFIAETACGQVGGDKAAWITDMFDSILTRYPRIVGVTWFNANKERDWRVESSTQSLNAFKTGAARFVAAP